MTGEDTDLGRCTTNLIHRSGRPGMAVVVSESHADALAGIGSAVPSIEHVLVRDAGYEEWLAGREFETARINSYIPRYQIFVALALALVLLEIFWPSRRKSSGVYASGHVNAGRQKTNQSVNQSANNDQKVAA